MDLRSLLEPRSVAIVGASAEPKKIAGTIIGFLAASGYAGRIYPVNPRYQSIGELACYASVEALPETVDLVVCVVPVAVAFEGVRSGRRFMAAVADARRRGKHVVVLRAGGHPESARSTQAHTGKHPAAFDVYAGILRQIGAIDVASLAELSYAMVLLTSTGARLGPRVGILSASGGACSLIADHVVDAGLELPQLPHALQQALDRAIPEYGSTLNPVDLSADVVSRAEILHGTLHALRAHDGIDVWLVFGRPIVDRYYPALIDFAHVSGKALIVSCGVPLEPHIHDALRAGGIAVLADPALCLRALGKIARAAGTRFSSCSDTDNAYPHPGARVPRKRTASASDVPQRAPGEELRAPANDILVHATIEDDRDFGPVLTLVSGAAQGRVVRALSASRDDLRTALNELAATRQCPHAALERYGTSAEQLAAVAIQNRAAAARHPNAHYRTAIDRAAYFASRMIAEPLRLLDCAPVSDGGGAVVVMAADRRAERSVEVIGAGFASTHMHLSAAPSLTTFGAGVALERALGQAGIGRAELVFADAFVPATNVLGKPGDGLRLALAAIGEARIGVAAHCLGLAQCAFDCAVTHLRVRRQFRRPLGRLQGLQWALMDTGIGAGERVGVMLSSVPEWVLYLFAVTRLGAVFVPINTRFRSRELEHVLGHSGARALIAMGRYLGHDYTATIAAVRSRLPHLDTLIGVRDAPHRDALDTDRLLLLGRKLVAERGAPPRADDAQTSALLFYTSGTTSFPKGVPLTHANLLAHSVRAGNLLELRPGESVLTLYPFFGISGGANKVLSTLGAGAALEFQDAFRAHEACDLLAAERCGVVRGVDVHIREMVAVQGQRKAGAQPERRATIAFTAGVDEALARAMASALGIRRFTYPYGMTETNPMILRSHLDDRFEACVKPGGRVAPEVEVRVVDPQTGVERAPGEEGEIIVRGPTVMRGYYNDPQATAAAFRDGWFHSGDLGVGTRDGLIFYVGRLKDMLKVGGFNVAPQEVESVLRTLPDILDVAVTGAPDARLGEAPVAFVQLKPGARATPETWIASCREQLANFKVPRAVYVVDALPYHTAAHGAKLQRHILREWAQARARGR